MSKTIAEKLQTIAENVPKVFESGIEQGKQIEYDEFWDKFQVNGNRTKYQYSFAGFFADVFKPKYNMTPVSAANMFNNFNAFGTWTITSKDYVDLVELLDKANVAIDFSECTNFQNWLMWANITRVGVIDCKSLTGSFNCYYAHQLRTIDKLILYEGNGTTFNWDGCSWLTNITIEGVIEKAFDIHYTKHLTHESLMSIINALKNLSGSGKTLTLTIGSDNLAKLTDSEKAIATQKGWTLA